MVAAEGEGVDDKPEDGGDGEGGPPEGEEGQGQVLQSGDFKWREEARRVNRLGLR